ncbi:hypothetical protein F2Q70_00001234 [Brassica cretica]|uniref:Uncharacterized protein n=1 Tax=Brassica cretica TaxID=69181 RepID=A0A8S9ITK5_BRACR|nr:hypothetical protein F2Q70_00001234 [Brassica cretica]
MWREVFQTRWWLVLLWLFNGAATVVVVVIFWVKKVELFSPHSHLWLSLFVRRRIGMAPSLLVGGCSEVASLEHCMQQYIVHGSGPACVVMSWPPIFCLIGLFDTGDSFLLA